MSYRLRLFSMLGWLAVMWLLTGCGLFDAVFETESDVPLELDFSSVLPVGWEPVDTWQEINIDGDTPVEYLLFYTYDNGQVGAVVYDSQNPAELAIVVGDGEPSDEAQSDEAQSEPPSTPAVNAEIVPLPAQAPGYYRPYVLLPSFWANSYGDQMGQGFVADPSQVNDIGVQEVHATDRLLERSGRAEDEEQTEPAPELVLRGGATHITFAWWKDRFEGYGVTQLYAPGGFRGIDWQEWQKRPELIMEVAGMYPLIDYRSRSLICRAILYQRAAPENAPPAASTSELPPPVGFLAQDRGFAFCEARAPEHPFYPEGVALAFWLAAQPNSGVDSDVMHLVTPGLSVAQLDADLGQVRFSGARVEDLQTYPVIPLTQAGVEGGFALTTPVCLELAPQDETSTRQWVVLTLRYQAADVEQRMPDRWTISGGTLEPPPVTEPESPYCQVILERGAP